MGRRYDNISFLSDYGSDDEFVGIVKAVLGDLAPHARVIDLSHGVPPFDVRAGSLALARCIPYVPSGVVLAVVDPGVGTARRAVAVEVAGGEGVLVGPDNGLLAPAVALAGGAERAVELTNSSLHLDAPGATFAGRDVFAPAAAHLCNGLDLAELGDEVDPGLLLPGVIPLPREERGELVAEVLWVDRYGNCQLNVSPDDLPPLAATDRVRLTLVDALGHERVRSAMVVGAFGDLGTAELGVVVDSFGLLAICLDRSSAAAELGLAAGDRVVLGPAGDAPARTVASPVRLRSRADDDAALA
jgi:S-adenosylmethionine hydrolase